MLCINKEDSAFKKHQALGKDLASEKYLSPSVVATVVCSEMAIGVLLDHCLCSHYVRGVKWPVC